MIKLINVSKTFTSKDIETKALSDINITLSENGLSFVCGKSGSGKTTLLNLIGAMDKVSEGDIIVDGKAINKMSALEINRYRNQQLGFVFQNSVMVEHLTIFENICLPLRANKIRNKTIIEKAEALIKYFDLENERNKYPNQVSGGQKQRAAIARALINDPKIILADEPTGALDSHNSKLVMEYLKDISKHTKVIMVSHDEELAKEYADEIIRLADGKIVSNDIKKENSEETINNDTKDNSGKPQYKRFNILISLMLSLRNMLSKKIRSIITILATSVGIVSTCIVILVSNSMTEYTEYAQKKALGSYPITISSNIVDDEIENDSTKYKDYPSEKKIYITNNYQSIYSHLNVFTNDYLNYLSDMDEDLYTVIDYGTSLNMHMMSYYRGHYKYLSSSSYLKRLSEDSSYLPDEYDLLYGDRYPSSKEELALVVDKNNCIDAYVLDYLGIDYNGIEEYTFEDICNKTFKIILNNDYYKYDSENDLFSVNAISEELYNASTLEVKITCIIRPKAKAFTKLYGTGLLYTSELFDYVHEDCVNSLIVQKQLEYGLERNVLNGLPYTDSVGDFTTIKKEYLYENALRNFGYLYNISYIKIYTDVFENRYEINKYLENYNIGKEMDAQVIYRDYMGSITEEFSKFITILRNVLIIFSAISLLVSSIMIAMLMYVGVMERINEIGLFRSIGYTKASVAEMFLGEGLIIGLTSGVLGLVGAITLIKPILNFVSGIVEEAYSTEFDISSITKIHLNGIEVIAILGGSVLITILASLIPALIGANKEPMKAINYRTN